MLYHFRLLTATSRGVADLWSKPAVSFLLFNAKYQYLIVDVSVVDDEMIDIDDYHFRLLSTSRKSWALKRYTIYFK
jgi:hypothetical protein